MEPLSVCNWTLRHLRRIRREFSNVTSQDAPKALVDRWCRFTGDLRFSRLRPILAAFKSERFLGWVLGHSFSMRVKELRQPSRSKLSRKEPRAGELPRQGPCKLPLDRKLAASIWSGFTSLHFIGFSLGLAKEMTYMGVINFSSLTSTRVVSKLCCCFNLRCVA